jgi:hypothetical protein
MGKIRYLSYLLVLSLFGCKSHYDPPVISSSNSYLVVEGNIDPSSDSTIITLSKTVKLNDTTSTANPLLGAAVTVESDHNGIWNLYDVNHNGNYISPGLNLPAGQKYQLRIITSDGRKYLSDLTAIKITQPIDSVGYIENQDNIQLYVNSHDPTNSSRYYRWDFDEAWKFHSLYDSNYMLDSATNTIVQRPNDKKIHFCYASDHASHIILNTTTRLASDVVFQSPLTTIPLSSEKLEDRYSILVKQYALTVEAYQFYQNLSKNTEKLGSIFDAQPTQLNGNIHCLSNPQEPVIGYLTVTNVQTKRIFIPTTDLYKTTILQTVYPYPCQVNVAVYERYSDGTGFTIEAELLGLPVRNIPISPVGPNLPPTAFYFSSIECMDCRIRGNINPPPFWK